MRRQTLVVKEFDVIIGDSDYENDENLKYLHKDAFDELLQFIREFQSDEDTVDALDFFSIVRKRYLGDVVTVKNYVGLIELESGYQIEILPKISFGDGEDKTRETFLKMLRSLKTFSGKVFNDAELRADRMNLYEIFINMYLQEVRRLVKRGIKSAYVQQEDNVRYYKGKLLVSKHIKENLTHRERFYVSYDEFHPDRPENKLVKSTLMKLQKLTGSAENSKLIRQLLTAFEMVEPSLNYQKDFSKVTIDRNTLDYKVLMEW